MEATVLTETDLALVDAVQLNPRASWSRIGGTLGVSAMTASRHWTRLAADGTVWTGSTMGPRLYRGAVVELGCRAGTTDEVIAALCERPEVYTVARTTGDFDLYALVVAPSVAALTTALFSSIAGIDAERVRSTIYTQLYGGPHWRLSVLDPAQSEQIRGDADRPLRSLVVDPEDRALFLALAADARRSFTDLADDLGSSPEIVRRRLGRLRRAGYLALRADMARPLAGWPLAALVWAAVPEDELDAVGRVVGAWTEVRFCAPVIHRSNMVLVVNLRAPEQLAGVEARLTALNPGLKISDRRLVLRMSKVNGHLLDDDGRSRGVVPVDPWTADPSSLR